MHIMTKDMQTPVPPLVPIRPWEDPLVPLAGGKRAGLSFAARALASSQLDGHGFVALAMRPGDTLWTGNGDGFGAVLFTDGTALLGESPDGSTLVAAPMVFAWRGLKGEAPRTWMAGALGESRRERLEAAAWDARDTGRWRKAAGWGERCNALAAGRKALAPWRPCAVRLSKRDHTFLSSLVWALIDAAGVARATLLGSALESGRLIGPSLVAEGIETVAKIRIGGAVASVLEQSWGENWRLRAVAQHREGHQAPLLSVDSLGSAHARLAAAKRFSDVRRWVQTGN